MAAHSRTGAWRETHTVWFVEKGWQGRWHACTFEYHDRNEAAAWMARRSANCPTDELRLVRRETDAINTVEETRP